MEVISHSGENRSKLVHFKERKIYFALKPPNLEQLRANRRRGEQRQEQLSVDAALR